MTRTSTMARWLIATPLFMSLAAAAQPVTNTQAAAPKPADVLPGRPDTDRAPARAAAADGKLLGDVFESAGAGIRFRPPAGLKQSPKAAAGETIVEYADDDRSWLLRVSRYAPPTPVKLTDGVDEKGEPKGGLLAYTAEKQRQSNVGSKILRQDVINVDNNFVGLIAIRFTQGTQRWLRQHAIVQASDAREQLYFIFTLTTPAGKVADAADPTAAAAVEEADPTEKEAVEAFNAMVDSVKILDRAPIKEEQNQRLYRTRALMVFWDQKKLDSILVPKSYYRIVRDGKDVGYTYVEEIADTQEVGGVGVKGIAAYVRAHTDERDPTDGHRSVVDVGSYRFMSYDHRHENWTRASVVQAEPKPGAPLQEAHATEFGLSSWETRRVPSTQIGVGDKQDPRNPLMRPVDLHVLDVNAWGKIANTEPVHIELPPFYLPQAGLHFLPRLAASKAYTEARSYLFANYAPEQRVLMMRYVDVSPEMDLTFNGARFRGRSVSERVGLDGVPTVHYVTSDEKYLGSETKQTHTLVLPSDEESIRRTWKDAVNFSRPEKLSGPQKQQ